MKNLIINQESVRSLFVIENVITDRTVRGTRKILLNPSKKKLDTWNKVYEHIYAVNCQETYCYPRKNMRVLSKAHKAAYDKFVKDGGVGLYARHNRMD